MLLFGAVYLFLLVFNELHTKCSSLKFVAWGHNHPSLQVTLPKGKVQGKMKQTMGQKMNYYSFEGIPYAMPPVGELRFKPPVEADSWKKILDASRTDVPSCIQVTPSIFNDFLESEDCLYINVYTPVKDLQNVKSERPYPVMVWIYGGGFLLGSANSTYFGPDNLLEQDVIVVNFGYRLASFGFLSTEDLESPGNYGLKDQHLALRWVKDNIQYFGGDQNKITLFGESAGSVSVQYHMMYPKNNGLFHGAISESGSVLCIWAFQRYPRKIAFDLGLAAGIKTTNSKQLIQALRNLSADKLRIATLKTSIANSIGIITGIPFAPTIEPDHPEAFVTNKSHQQLVDGNVMKVPYIIGFNSEEACAAKPAFSIINPILGLIEFNPDLLVPSGMNAGEATRQAGREIKKFYFGHSGSKSDQYLEYINDGYFSRPIIESVRLFGLQTPTFMYTFTYEGLLGRSSQGHSQVGEYKGVLHTEEMAYIWLRNDLPEPTSMDKIVRARMVKMWTNFAKTGNPTPQEDPLFDKVIWPTAVTRRHIKYLEIDKKMSVKRDYKDKCMKFWKDLYERYGSPPYDTY